MLKILNKDFENLNDNYSYGLWTWLMCVKILCMFRVGFFP